MSKFCPLDTPKALGILNTHLSNESYINGFGPSQDDVIVFNALSTLPESKWIHIVRWFNHITSFGDLSKDWKTPEDSVVAASVEEEEIDIFAEETEEEKAANEARKNTKSSKPAVIARSIVVLDVKPWDETTDMIQLEAFVRQIEIKGLEWKASSLVDVAFGIKKLQIVCHIVDDLVFVDEDIIPKITAFEDYVQSVDIFAFNKL